MAVSRTPKDLYHGNAAYDLSYVGDIGLAEEVQQPNPQVLPRKKAKSKARTRARAHLRVRKQQKVSPVAIGGFLAVAAFAVLLLVSYANLIAASHRVAQLKNEIQELEVQGDILQAKYECTFDLNAIEEQFTAIGTMAKPRMGQVVYVDMSEPDSAQVIRTEDGRPGLESFFAMAVEYFK